MSDVAEFFDVSKKRLLYHLYQRPKKYRAFEIPKSRGGSRLIEAPPVPVLVFQKRLSVALSELYRPKRSTQGFVRSRSVVTNAKKHLGSQFVLNLDLADFFHSIHFGRVFGVFKSAPLSLPHNVAAVLAHLCCNNERLPQGAPTSPVVSNLVCRTLDLRLSRLANATRTQYTRYGDDISFSRRSSPFPDRIGCRNSDGAFELSDELVKIIRDEGFSVNEKKTRVMSSDVRQEVTGVTVNSRLNVHRNFVRSLRGALHCWRVHGYEEASRRFESLYDRKARRDGSPPLANHIKGKLSYLSMVRGSGDLLVARYQLEFARLSGHSAVLSGSAALKPRYLREALWLVLGVDGTGGPVVNGTAVAVNGLGLVTNSHVINDSSEEIVRWVIARADEPSRRFEFEVVWEDTRLDLAILRCEEAFKTAELVCRFDSARQGESVLVAGFPDWLPGAYERIEGGHVTYMRWISARLLVQTSCSVYTGNSGGPVLGEDGLLVAIATYGGSATFPNSCVSATHFPAFPADS